MADSMGRAFWHGTSRRAAAQILRSGLDPAHCWSGYAEEEGGQCVFLARDRATAQEFVRGRGVVLVVRPPAAVARRWSRQRAEFVRSRVRIPAAWITVE